MRCPWCNRNVLMPPDEERDHEQECPTCHGTYTLEGETLIGSVKPDYIPPPPEQLEPSRVFVTNGYEPGVPGGWYEHTNADGTVVLVRYER